MIEHAVGIYIGLLLLAGFGCAFFSLVVQGITMKPLMLKLGIKGE